LPVLLLAAAGSGSAARQIPRSLSWPAIGWLLGSALSSAVAETWDLLALLPAVLGTAAVWLGWHLGRRRDVDLVLGGLGASAVIVALHGTAQHLGWDPLPRVDEFPDRIVGPFVNPNHLAGYTAATLPLLLISCLRAWGAEERHTAAGVLLGLASLLGYSLLLLIGSRGALGAGLAGVAVAVAAYGRAVRLGRRRLRLGGPLLLLLAMVAVTLALRPRPVLVGPVGQVSVGERLQAMSHVAGEAAVADHTVLHRRVLWRTAWALFADAPWLGVGPGRYDEAGKKVLAALADDREVVRLASQNRLVVLPHAHNEPLHVAAETGLVGLLPLACLVGIGWLCALGVTWRTGDLQTGTATASCAAVAVHGLVSYPLHLPATAACFWILLGISFYRGSAPETR
jgi:O-antigen ligase